jgi:hypothetical protein
MKTGKKSGTMRSPRSGAEVPTGAHPGNTGGKKGRSGRKPFAFRMLARTILEDRKTQAELRRAAHDRSTPGYGTVIRLLRDSAEDKEGVISLETVGRYLEQLSMVIAKHVKEPDVLARIEADARAIPLRSD